MTLGTEYIDQFTDYETYVKVGEYEIPLPKSPPAKDIINYKLPIEKQLFQRTRYNINGNWIYAHQINKTIWRKLSESQRKDIADIEWKRRFEGLWIYIKGRKIWIPPNMYMFLNYWTFPDNSRPAFWDSQLFSFLLSHWAFHHELILGKVKIKGRRGGGTAEEDSNLLHYTTAYRGSVSGIMNKTEAEAKKLNFDKIVHALLNYPEFFQPKRSGERRPQKEILFSPPSVRLTKKLDEKEEDYYSENYLNSYINYIATSEIGYDGDKMRFILIDEIFKWKNISPIKAIEIQSLCIKDGGIKNNITDQNSNIIEYAGLISALSSVEEINDDQLEDIRKLWDSCDPKTGSATFISAANSIRYFEPFYFGFKGFIDEYGFSDVEKCKIHHRLLENQIRKTKGKKAAIDFRRKHPETIEQAIMPSTVKCVFNLDVLERAKLNYYEALPDAMKPKMYRLEWIEKFKSVRAIIMEDENDFSYYARWEISHIPDESKRNANFKHGEFLKPANRGVFTMAVDPIEYDVRETSEGTSLSSGACRVKREFDATIDGDKFDEDGNPIEFGFGFETNRTVCIYVYRPDDSEEFWDDMAKTAIFYGSPVLMEATSRGMKKYFIDNGLAYFLLNNDGSEINYSNKDNIGWKASKEAKNQQFEYTDNYISRFGCAERHIKCILDILVTNKENLTKHDLTAAYTIGECASSLLSERFNKTKKEKIKDSDKITVIRKRITKYGQNKSRWITN